MRKSSLPAMISVFAFAATPGYAQQVVIPEPVLSVWSDLWNNTVEELSAEIVTALEKKLPVARRAAFVEDLKDLVDQNLSWAALGKSETERILLQHCGIELLNDVSPYFHDSARTMPSELQETYLDCAIDAQLYVKTTPAYALLELGRDELPDLYRKHGIDPQGL